MVNPSIILRKVVFIRDHIDRIRAQADCTLEEFLSDRNRQDIVCFNLMQAIQACADLANHLVSVLITLFLVYHAKKQLKSKE